MASESSTTTHVTPAPNVAFECEKGAIAFNNGIVFDFSSINGLSYSKNYVGLPTKETVKAMNTNGTIDKSLSGTTVQSTTQSKAPTDKKSQKKKISSSSEPKASTYSLEASESVEEVANQPSIAATKNVTILNLRGTTSDHSQTYLGESGEDKGYPRPNRESESARLYLISSVHSESSLRSDTLRKIQMDTNAEITFMGDTALDQIIKEAESDVEYMPDDKIISILGDDEEEFGDSDNEFSIPN
ncbi:hypothetical protein Tco_0299046 [Tanacetum coccineum]